MHIVPHNTLVRHALLQCYDRFMLSSLGACAQQVRQPHWGALGPHDAGSYCQWPHQTGFFHHQGSWQGEYGQFFMQWYSGLLERHADRLLGAAAAVLGGRDVRLHARLPLIHWWYHTAAHAVSRRHGRCTERAGLSKIKLSVKTFFGWVSAIVSGISNRVIAIC